MPSGHSSCHTTYGTLVYQDDARWEGFSGFQTIHSSHNKTNQNVAKWNNLDRLKAKLEAKKAKALSAK